MQKSGSTLTKVGVLWQGQAHGSHICHIRFEKCSGESTHIHTHGYAHTCIQTHKLYILEQVYALNNKVLTGNSK